MIIYIFKCHTCNRVAGLRSHDPSKAPICCGGKMDAIPQDEEALIQELGF